MPRLATCLLVSAACLSIALSPAALVSAQTDEVEAKYKQHMTNGVKLFQDRNYDAAIAEFSAAYAVKPKASPLVNIALSHKAAFRYPKAIAVLEDALAKHADTLDPQDRKAAEDAIQELRGLLAYVTVKVVPPNATITIDGEALPKGAPTRNVPLGPGPHTISASADGYATKSERVTVASGERDRTVELQLVPDKGFVTLKAKDPSTILAIDKRPLAKGTWSGFVSPGTHRVQMYTSHGRNLYAPEFTIAAGEAMVIEEGAPLPAVAVVPEARAPTTANAEPPPPSKQGFYGLGIGIVNASLGSFAADGAGWSIGLRGGYRPTTILGLELSLAYARTPTLTRRILLGPGSTVSTDPKGQETEGELEAIRAGGNLRLMSRGSVARFVATFGGGVSHNVLSCSGCEGTNGTSAYGFFETGFEIDIRGVFFGLTLQNLVTGLAIDQSSQTSTLIGFGDFQGQVGLGLVGGYGTW